MREMGQRSRAGLTPAVAIVGVAALVGLLPGTAAAEPVGTSGTVSVIVPRTADAVPFTITIIDQTFDNETVDGTHGGILTVGWTGSQDQPQSSVVDCPADEAGTGLLVEGISPGASIWATFASGTDQEILGPFEVTSRHMDAIAAVCTDDGDGGTEVGEPTGDPGDGEGEEDGGHPVPGCGNGHDNGHGNGNGNGNGSNGGGNGSGSGSGNGNGNGGGNGSNRGGNGSGSGHALCGKIG